MLSVIIIIFYFTMYILSPSIYLVLIYEHFYVYFSVGRIILNLVLMSINLFIIYSGMLVFTDTS